MKKIEKVLKEAGKPSYKKMDTNNSDRLLFLYRARNSMHEGDCFYKDNSGNIIHITSENQVGDFVTTVEDFTLWIDSLV